MEILFHFFSESEQDSYILVIILHLKFIFLSYINKNGAEFCKNGKPSLILLNKIHILSKTGVEHSI